MRKRVATAALAVVLMCAAFMLCACTQGYTPQERTPTIDGDALKEPGVLLVGIDASTFPFAGEADGRISGIDVDVAAAIADEMGLKIELVDIGMNDESAIAEGTVDVVMSVDSSAVLAEECWTSEPYLPSCIALFSADASAEPPALDSSPVIAAQSSSLSALLVTQDYGQNSFKAYDSPRNVFSDLADGTVEFAASDAVVGSYVLNLMGIDASIVALFGEPGGYCIGASPDNVELQQAVTQALSAIKSNGVMDVITTRWVGHELDISNVRLVGSEEPAADAPEEAQEPQEQPAEQPAEQPQEQPVEQPAEQPVEQPVEVWEAPAETWEAPVETWEDPAQYWYDDTALQEQYVDDGGYDDGGYDDGAGDVNIQTEGQAENAEGGNPADTAGQGGDAYIPSEDYADGSEYADYADDGGYDDGSYNYDEYADYGGYDDGSYYDGYTDYGEYVDYGGYDDDGYAENVEYAEEG